MEAIRQGDIPGVQLRQRLDLSLSRDELWRWLCEDDLLLRWAAAQVRRGGDQQLELRLSDAEGGGWERWRTVLSSPEERWVVHLERLSAGWPVATPLTFELRPLAAGAQLSVRQEGFHQLPLSACLTIWEQYRNRWRMALGRLEAAVDRSRRG